MVFTFEKSRERFKRKIFSKVLRHPKIPNYPADIREYILSDNFEGNDGKLLLDNLPDFDWKSGDYKSLLDSGITIFGETVPCKNNEIDWALEKQDKEYSFAIHRFWWLLSWISKSPKQEYLIDGFSVILNWIEKFQHKKDQSIWETYSASERVINWLTFLVTVKDFVSIDEKTSRIINSSINDHLNHIVLNLEYHQKNLANNHIINNAKALYFGGRLLGSDNITKLGRMLLDKHTNLLVQKDGYLTELSSHYQLLICKTYTEIVTLAKLTGDMETFELYRETSINMNRASQLFKIKNQFDTNTFPRIGDVSPDFPVEWFLPNNDMISVTSNWWNIWGKSVDQNVVDLDQKSINKTNVGWIKVEKDSWTCLSLAVPKNRIYPAGHSHLDFGSFLLYQKGNPIFIDIGRYSYQSEPDLDDGYNAESHNSVVVNGLPIIPDGKGINRYFNNYYYKNTDFDILEDEGTIKMLWKSLISGKPNSKSIWNRKLTLSKSEFTLEDNFTGSFNKNDNCNINFHLSNNCFIESANGSIHLNSNGVKLKLKFKGIESLSKNEIDLLPSIKDGNIFPNYGVKEQSKILSIKSSLFDIESVFLSLSLDC